MNRRMLGMIVSTVLAYAAFGCSPCNHTGMSIAAGVSQAAAGADGAAHAMVEIHGTGFTPNTMVAIHLEHLPTLAKDTHAYADTSAISNAEGTFSWSKDVSVFPDLDHSADPNADVMVTAKEVYISCTAKATIKAGALLNPGK